MSAESVTGGLLDGASLLPAAEVDEIMHGIWGSVLLGHEGTSCAPGPSTKRLQAAVATVIALNRERRWAGDEGRLRQSAIEGLRARRVRSAVQVQALWRGHAARRSALRLYELRVWDEDLSARRSVIVAVVYLAALLLLGAATYMCLVYGILFTPQQGRAWILTSLASFALDLLVQKPIIIFLNACAFVAWGACTGRTHAWTNVSPNFVSPSGSWLGLL